MLLATGVWICSMSFLVDSRTPPKSYLKSKPDISLGGPCFLDKNLKVIQYFKFYRIFSNMFFSENFPWFPISYKPHSAVCTLKLFKILKVLVFQNYDDSMGVCPLLGFYTFTVFFVYRAAPGLFGLSGGG